MTYRPNPIPTTLPTTNSRREGKTRAHGYPCAYIYKISLDNDCDLCGKYNKYNKIAKDYKKWAVKKHILNSLFYYYPQCSPWRTHRAVFGRPIECGAHIEYRSAIHIERAAHKRGYHPFLMGFMVGNSNTSLMEALSVKSITMRSMPIPIPPVGGIPYSNAARKSSSSICASSSPA